MSSGRIERKDYQYLYADGDLYYFMDVETYDQIALSKDDIGDALKFVKGTRWLSYVLTTEAYSP